MSIFDKMKQGASEAAKRAQLTVETTKLRSKISTREKEMDRISTRIGKAVFDAYTVGDLSQSEEQVLAYCEELAELREEISQIEETIKKLKEEKTCVCGKVVGPDVNFCPDCGKRFVDEPRQEDTTGEIRVICYHCKTENDINSKYCIQCGEELSST
ncbi:zinc ribbon domain-containing protein [Paenibacillus pinihumi]|uniref:zinc ribbon domain-containing protein n=1 Tax=Paenibacillus pinihumi TaxID=669462 RepID=UPI000410B437|nr:zinc ribbon domain-containing protein [Paenibacillus pinihumi]